MSYAFATLTLPFFTDLHSQWYLQRETDGNGNLQNIQVLPSNIADLLTPRAIAYWIGGSFNKARGVIRISTDCFTPAEVDLLRSILLEKYNLIFILLGVLPIKLKNNQL